MKKQIYYIIISFIIVSLDLLTKYIVLNNFETHETKDILGNIIIFKLVMNKGIILGLFDKSINPSFLILTKIFIIIGLLYLPLQISKVFKSEYLQTRTTLAIVFMAGGLLGNTIDRFINKGVVDFISISFTNNFKYIFNIADSFLILGLVLLVTTIIFYVRIQYKIS